MEGKQSAEVKARTRIAFFWLPSFDDYAIIENGNEPTDGKRVSSR
jgi:hypothetical protein